MILGKKQEILYKMACLDCRHMFLSCKQKKQLPLPNDGTQKNESPQLSLQNGVTQSASLTVCFSKMCCKGKKVKDKKMERKQEGNQKGEKAKTRTKTGWQLGFIKGEEQTSMEKTMLFDSLFRSSTGLIKGRFSKFLN